LRRRDHRARRERWHLLHLAQRVNHFSEQLLLTLSHSAGQEKYSKRRTDDVLKRQIYPSD
jgi:hypothetical protein